MADEGKTIQTIYNKLWIPICVSKAFGLLQMRIHGERLTRESLFGRVFSMFFVIIPFSWLSIINCWHNLLDIIAHVKVVDLVFMTILQRLGNFLVIDSHLYRQYTNATSEIQIIESLGLYDRKVKQLRLVRKDRFLFSWIINVSITFTTMTTFHHITDVVIDNASIWQLFYMTFYECIVPMVTCLAYAKFFTIAHLLYQRYNHLNEFVLPKSPSRRADDNLRFARRRFVRMHDLVYLHSTLTKATKTLAKSYSFELFIWSCSPIWEFPRALLAIIGGRGVFYNYVVLTHVLMRFIILCWICHTTAHEANRFARSIIKTDPKCIHTLNDREELQAAVYLYNNKITFKAWLFFDINLATFYFIAWFTLSLGLIYLDKDHEGGRFD